MVNKINSKTGLMAIVLVSATILFSSVQANVVRGVFSGLKYVASAAALIAGAGGSSLAYTLDDDWQKKYKEASIRVFTEKFKKGDFDVYNFAELNRRHLEEVKKLMFKINTFRKPTITVCMAVASLGLTSIVMRQSPRIILVRLNSKKLLSNKSSIVYPLN